jgi:hypothetical protein
MSLPDLNTSINGAGSQNAVGQAAVPDAVKWYDRKLEIKAVHIVGSMAGFLLITVLITIGGYWLASRNIEALHQDFIRYSSAETVETSHTRSKMDEIQNYVQARSDKVDMNTRLNEEHIKEVNARYSQIFGFVQGKANRPLDLKDAQ